MPASAASKALHRLNAPELRELLRAATHRLEQRASVIDRLNVFPIPDADTGSNMLYGLRRGLREADRERAATAGEVAAAFARGALAGARGNSGLILSQFWRGLAEAARGALTLGAQELARGLAEGSRLAFRAVARPVPGTILTVMEDVARAALRADGTLAAFLGRLAAAARESVARTPQLLAVLRRSGVVDAGAEGLHRILEGAWLYAQERAGQPVAGAEAFPEPVEPMAPTEPAGPVEGAPDFGTCTEFFLQGRALDPDAVRTALQELGDSLIVTADADAVRVHIHSRDPLAVLERAAALGRPAKLSLRDMDAQHRERGRGGMSASEGQAVVARVPGRGLAEVFRSLGAAEAVVRGQTGEEARLIAAFQSLPAEDLLLVPDQPDALPGWASLRTHTPKRLHVLPSRTVPQAVAAMLAFDPGAELAENLRRMEEAIAEVGSLEILQRSGRVVGLVEGRPAAEGEGLVEVLERLLPTALPQGRGPAQRLTLYYAAELAAQEAWAVGERLRAAHPGLQVEVLAGGQPGRGLIAAVE